jgi:hypothetical protein
VETRELIKLVGLHKAWVWLKNYWYIPIILVLILVAAFSGSGIKNKYFDILLKAKENHRKEVEIIEKNHAEEKQKTQNAIKKYQENVSAIEKDFNVKMEELPKKQKKEVDKIIEKYEDDTDAMAKEIANILGARND